MMKLGSITIGSIDDIEFPIIKIFIANGMINFVAMIIGPIDECPGQDRNISIYGTDGLQVASVTQYVEWAKCCVDCYLQMAFSVRIKEIVSVDQF